MNKDQKTIDKLFRDLIRVYSTSATSLLGLDSIQTAIKELDCKDSNLGNEIIKLSDVVKMKVVTFDLRTPKIVSGWILVTGATIFSVYLE